MRGWLQGLASRTAALSTLAGRMGDGGLAGAGGKRLLERPLGLGHMFHPEILLNALRQQTARTSTPAGEPPARRPTDRPRAGIGRGGDGAGWRCH